MPHGAPDWNKYRRESATFPVQDMAELAARLGSPVVFDRRGDVYWFDDFEHGFNRWGHTGSGTDNTQLISPDFPFHGGYSIKLTTGSTPDSEASMYTFLPYTQLGQWGLEVSFNPNFDLLYSRFTLTIYTGTYRHQASVRYDYANTRLEYLDLAGNWQTVPLSLDPDITHPYWSTIKLVADFPNDLWTRILLNDYAYPMLTPAGLPIPLYAPLDDPDPALQIEIYAQGPAVGNEYTYIDNVIITRDEP